MSRWISFLVLAAIIGVFGFLFWQVMSQFLLPLFIAVVLVVVFRPMHQWMFNALGGRPHVAAACSTVSILVIVLLPFATILSLAAAEAVGLGSRLAQEQTLYDLERMRNDLGLWLPSEKGVVADSDIRSSMTDLERAVRRIEQGQPRGRKSPADILEDIHPKMDVLLDELDAARRQETEHGLWDDEEEPWIQNRIEATRMLERMLVTTRRLQKELARAEERHNSSTSPEPGTAKSSDTPPASQTPAPPEPPNPSVLPGPPPADADEPAQTEEPEPAASDDAAEPKAPATADATSVEEAAEPVPLLSAEHIAELQELRDDYEQFNNKLFGLQASFGFKQVFNPTKGTMEQVLAEVQDWLAPVAQGTFTIIGKFIIGLIVMAVALFFFLLDGEKMVASVMALSPLDDRHERELLAQFEKISRAVVLATLATAVCQGLLGGLGYWFVGLRSYVLLTMLTMVTSMIPFVGAAAVWITCSVFLLLTGDWPHAIGLAIWGAAVVSMVDNVVKPYILHGQSNLHPLLALVSVIGGVAAMGPIGIFIGPMAVAFLQALLQIMHLELESIDGPKQTAAGEEDWRPGSGSILVGPFDADGAAVMDSGDVPIDAARVNPAESFQAGAFAPAPVALAPSGNGEKPKRRARRRRRRRKKTSS